jgi:pyridoxamine 5'-phosphate oxidase-like protein
MRWAEFVEAAPELAALGRARIEQFGFVFLGTIRKDGGPRVNPVEAFIVEGDLALSMIWRSLKALDLLRDPRAYIHTPILERDGGSPGEFKLRGRALPIEDGALREAVADTLERESGYRPPERWHLFGVDVESAVFHHYDPDDSQQHMTRWTPERGLESSTRRYL